MGRGPNPTPHGHNFGEAASALQKELRRGKEEEALYWAVQLDLGGYPHYVWRRLKVTCEEDVGVANPDLIVQVTALHEGWKEMHGRNPDQHAWDMRGKMAMAVMLIARSPKSRVANDATCVMWNEALSADLQYRREVPDYAVDMHTGRGRRMGRDHEHYLAEGSKLVNEAEIENPYAERMAWWILPEDAEDELPTDHGTPMLPIDSPPE
jgi:replication-associated recombination protein RarA